MAIPVYSSKALPLSSIGISSSSIHYSTTTRPTIPTSSHYPSPSNFTLLLCLTIWSFLIYIHFIIINNQPLSVADTNTAWNVIALPNTTYSSATEVDSQTDRLSTYCQYEWPHPPLMYSYTALVVEDEHGLGPGVRVTIQLRDKNCHLHPAFPSPRAYFRVYAIGAAIAAIDSPIYLQPNQPHVTAFLRLPDPSTYTLNVRLMLFNFTSHMLSDTVSSYYIFPPSTPGAFFDQAVLEHESYISNITFLISSNAQGPARLTYEQLSTYKPGTRFISVDTNTGTSLPPCGSDRHTNGSLAGRLVLGPQHEKILRKWPSDNIFDEYDAIWAPYDCAIDYTLDMTTELTQVRWLNFIGDSNARHLFASMCEQTGSVHHVAPKEIRSLDPPQMCIGMANNEPFVLTYSNWFYGKIWPLNHTLSFGEQCRLYENNTLKYGRFIGWPNCEEVPKSIQELQYPGLTYLSWGSHQAERGASTDTFNLFLNEVHGNEYFKHANGLFAFTTAVDGTLIPAKFGRQQLYRSNERISAVNDLQVEAVARLMPSYPIFSKGGDTSESKPYFPIFDVFSFTHSSNERHHGDAVHFWSEIQIVIGKLLTHWIHYAPQMHRDNARRR